MTSASQDDRSLPPPLANQAPEASLPAAAPSSAAPAGPARESAVPGAGRPTQAWSQPVADMGQANVVRPSDRGVATPRKALPLPAEPSPQADKPGEPSSAEAQRELAKALAEHTLLGAPPWLSSLAVHLAVLLALGTCAIHQPREERKELVVSLDQDQGEQLDEEPLAIAAPVSPDTEQAWSPSPLPNVDDPFASPPELEVSLNGATPAPAVAAPTVGLAFDGRSEGNKQRLLAQFGGNARSEKAVLDGLRWLAAQQREDGLWSLMGKYPDGAGAENLCSATAMALLAFQGAGNTHRQGTFKDQVASGVAALLKMQDAEGNFFHDGRQTQWFYAQAQCTIALCELYGMTRDDALREPAARAVEFLIKGQDALGGWRYGPQAGSDLSVTGWVLMALESGKMAGLRVEQDVLYRVSDFLDTVESDGGTRYCYMPQHAPTETMTAEGMLCREYLGWKRDDERLLEMAEYLVSKDNLPSWKARNVYFWYYATQALHHLESKHWEVWNERLRELLVEKQEKKGKNKGSWSPLTPEPDRWGYQGGRLYVTCMSLYMLEVYYRHMPLYSSRVLEMQ